MQDLSALMQADGEIVADVLDRWAEAEPDRHCIFYGEDETSLTYGCLSRHSDSIAGNLAALGVQPGNRVSLFLRNPLVTTEWMFGIWKAGAIFCPINFSFTGRLLNYQLNDTRPRILITERSMVATINEAAADLIEPPPTAIYDAPDDAHDAVHLEDRVVLDSHLEEIPYSQMIAPRASPLIHISFDSPANIVYTSGTTGPSKGVLQQQRWINQYTFVLRATLTPDDTVYSDLPMYHVGGAMANVARAIWAGASVALWDRFSAKHFWERIHRSNATTAILLDVMIPWLTKAPPSSDDRFNSLNKAHMQPLPIHHHDIASRFGIDIVSAGFGQTEAGAPLVALIEETSEGSGTPAKLYRGRSHAAMATICEGLRIPYVHGDKVSRKGFMGKPTPFVEAILLDDQDQECDPGVPGQLAFRPSLPGVLVQEYMGKPEATIGAFRNLWFHSGDSAIRDIDGTFYFVDRLGDRIRVRGENVSSFHVEDLINQHPAVEMCAAFPIPSEEGDEDDIAAYVVAVSGGLINLEEFGIWAKAHMPKFMVPRHIRIVTDLPRTPTNKIEKYKLRAELLIELDRN